MSKSSKYTRQDILRKAKAMIDHAESAGEIGNQAEAEAFSRKVHQYLQKHNLEMSEVEGFKQQREDEITHTEGDDMIIVDRKAQYGRWDLNLICTLAQYNYCEVLVHGERLEKNYFWEKGDPKGQRVILIGAPENIQVVKYLHAFLSRTILRMGEDYYDEKRHELRMKACVYARDKTEAAEKIADKFGLSSANYFYDNVVRLKNEYADHQEMLDGGYNLYGVQEFGKLPKSMSPMGYKPKFVESYLNGAVVGIGQKLEEDMDGLTDEVRERAEGLIKVNDAAIQKYKDENFNLTKSRSRRRKINMGAYAKGRKDGKGLSMRKGVSAGTTGQAALTS